MPSTDLPTPLWQSELSDGVAMLVAGNDRIQAIVTQMEEICKAIEVRGPWVAPAWGERSQRPWAGGTLLLRGLGVGSHQELPTALQGLHQGPGSKDKNPCWSNLPGTVER